MKHTLGVFRFRIVLWNNPGLFCFWDWLYKITSGTFCFEGSFVKDLQVAALFGEQLCKTPISGVFYFGGVS